MRDDLIEETVITLSHIAEHINGLIDVLSEEYDRPDQDLNFAECLLESIFDAYCTFENYRECTPDEGNELADECYHVICELADDLSDAHNRITSLCNMHKEKLDEKSYGKSAQKN